MDNLKTVIASLVVAVVAAVSIVVLLPHSAPPSQKAGAVASPVIPSPYVQWGGINHYGAIDSMTSTASTTCSIQSPSATSTLKGVTVDFSNLPSYSEIYELGVSAFPNATTTPLVVSYTTGAASYEFAATSTVTSIIPDGILPPNYWVNLLLSTSTAVNDGITGECTASFEQILN